MVLIFDGYQGFPFFMPDIRGVFFFCQVSGVFILWQTQETKMFDFKSSSFLSHMLNAIPTPSPCTFLGGCTKSGNPYIRI